MQLLDMARAINKSGVHRFRTNTSLSTRPSSLDIQPMLSCDRPGCPRHFDAGIFLLGETSGSDPEGSSLFFRLKRRDSRSSDQDIPTRCSGLPNTKHSHPRRQQRLLSGNPNTKSHSAALLRSRPEPWERQSPQQACMIGVLPFGGRFPDLAGS